jgi:hypothetical protein
LRSQTLNAEENHEYADRQKHRPPHGSDSEEGRLCSSCCIGRFQRSTRLASELLPLLTVLQHKSDRRISAECAEIFLRTTARTPQWADGFRVRG